MLWLAALSAILLSACTSHDSDRAGVEAGNTKVAGILRDSTGKAIPLVPVALSRASASIVDSDTTDSMGAFEFQVPEGTYSLIAQDSSGWHSLQAVDVDGEDSLQMGSIVWTDQPVLSSGLQPLSSSSSGIALSSGTLSTMTDSRDGQVYATIQLGGRTWMSQNLNYSGDNGAGARAYTMGWCYGQDTTIHTENDSCRVQGRFYNWTQAMAIDTAYINAFYNGTDTLVQGICPSGWRLPSEAEWLALQDSLGGMMVAAAAMREGGTSGFNAKMTGYLLTTVWEQPGEIAMFWSAKESGSQYSAKSFNVGYNVDYLIENDTYKYQGLSIRCVYSRVESDH
jgi:uncharacterized protein (TIGR02145 family)